MVLCSRLDFTYASKLVVCVYVREKGNSVAGSRYFYVYSFESDWNFHIFHWIICKITRWRDLTFFSKICIFKQHKYRHFLKFSTRAFNYYKLKCGECLCLAHELRVKVINFDINYLRISTVKKFEINLGYK